MAPQITSSNEVLDTVLGRTSYETALKYNDLYRESGFSSYNDSVDKYIEIAIQNGCVDAYAWKGHSILFERTVTQNDTSLALELIRYAAENNSNLANFDLGIYLFCTGKYNEGEKHLLIADSLGNPYALYELSLCYSRGEPSVTIIGCQYNAVPIDKEKELKYCKMAADKGNIYAQISMMYFYMNENNDNAFKCVVIQILKNSELHLEQNTSAFDEIDMLLIEKYGGDWNDTIKTWTCEN